MDHTQKSIRKGENMKRGKKGLFKRFYENMGFGPGGPFCACCSDLRTSGGERFGKKDKSFGRTIRRKERQSFRLNPMEGW